MIWTSSDTLALAEQGCAECLGLGLRILERGEPCHCVTRAIFRACYKRFRDAADKLGNYSRVTLGREARPGQHVGGYGRKNEEYAADFIIVARRALGAESLGYEVFRFHFLQGADWKLCGRRLELDKGEFFHEVYRVENAVGRACFECEPHPLFPLGVYFSSGSRASRSGLTSPERKATRDGAAARRRPRAQARPPLASFAGAA
jgi:hypothetical protein